MEGVFKWSRHLMQNPLIARVQAFDQKSKRNQRLNYFLCYTLLFVALFLLVFGAFFRGNYSFIWIVDGVDQHYTAFRYFGIYIRQIIRELFTTGKFVLPMWDFTIGQGSDIITTLQYYCIGDPFAFISVLFPSAKAELGYMAAVAARIYCAGLAFSVFCFGMKQKRLSTLSGAFVYIFCGFVLMGLRHPYFINPLICLPLLCLGAEYVLERRKPHLFVFAVFLAGISNFYFFYILSLLTVLYIVVRYFCKFRKREFWTKLLPTAGRMLAFYFIGFALAAVLFLPVAKWMLASTRLEGTGDKLFLLYSPSYYWYLINQFTGAAAESYWSVLGFAGTGALCAAALFGVRKNRHLGGMKWLYALFILFLCIPFAGFIFNGFGYVTNRWVFAFAFLLAFTTVVMIPRLAKGIPGRSLVSMLVLALILLFPLLFRIEDSSSRAYLGFGVFVLTLLGIVLLNAYRHKFGASYPRVFSIVVLCFTIFSVAVNGEFTFAADKKGYVTEFAPVGESAAANSNALLRTVMKTDQDGFYRVAPYRIWTYGETNADRTARKYDKRKRNLSNTGMLQHYNGVGSYFSLVNPYYTQYCKDMILNDQNAGNWICGLDNRTVLNTLANVKYSTVASGDKPGKSYGFQPVAQQKTRAGKKETLYQNTNYLPFGYTYRSVISEKDYAVLNPVDKQQAMLQGAVLSGDDGVSVPQTAYKKDGIVSSCTIAQANANQKKQIVFKKDETVPLSFQSTAGSEVYLVLTGVKITPEVRKSTKADNGIYSIRLKSGGVSVSKSWKNPGHGFAFGQDAAVFYLGYQEKAVEKAALSISASSTLQFDEIQVVSVPMDDFSNRVNALKADTMQNVKMETNRVSGTIDLKENKLLCMTIPYSEGWTAAVDGKPAELLRINTMYTGLDLQPGSHTIELKYHTPLLREGFIISAATFAAYGSVTLFLFLRRKNRNKALSK